LIVACGTGGRRVSGENENANVKLNRWKIERIPLPNQTGAKCPRRKSKGNLGFHELIQYITPPLEG